MGKFRGIWGDNRNLQGYLGGLEKPSLKKKKKKKKKSRQLEKQLEKLELELEMELKNPSVHIHNGPYKGDISALCILKAPWNHPFPLLLAGTILSLSLVLKKKTP
jgi:hypothetical protein